MATTLCAATARCTVIMRELAARLCARWEPTGRGPGVVVAGRLGAALWVAGALVAVDGELEAVPSLPDAALLALEMPTAWWALLMSVWNCPRACLEVPPLLLL